jgi:hypothetical protein
MRRPSSYQAFSIGERVRRQDAFALLSSYHGLTAQIRMALLLDRRKAGIEVDMHGGGLLWLIGTSYAIVRPVVVYALLRLLLR